MTRVLKLKRIKIFDTNEIKKMDSLLMLVLDRLVNENEISEILKMYTHEGIEKSNLENSVNHAVK